MFSRLYLGVHSPADIVAGGIIGCVILAYWIKIDSIVDRSISFGDNGMYCCSTDSLIVHFQNEWYLSSIYNFNTVSIRHTDCVKNVLYLCQFAHLSWASLGFHGLRQQGVLLLSLSPPSWWNAGQASLALIVQIESHTTVRGKFLEQVGTTEALPGSWTWTCQFRV